MTVRSEVALWGQVLPESFHIGADEDHRVPRMRAGLNLVGYPIPLIPRRTTGLAAS
jgi:hypothetical protein